MNCPLCCSRLTTYAINLSESVILCEYPTCTYPFGYEAFTYIKKNNNTDQEKDSLPIVPELSLCDNKTSKIVQEKVLPAKLDLSSKVKINDYSQDKSKPSSTPPSVPRIIIPSVQYNRNPSRIKNPSFLSKIQFVTSLKTCGSPRRKPISPNLPSAIKTKVRNCLQPNNLQSFDKFSFDNDNLIEPPAKETKTDVETSQSCAPANNSSLTDVSSIHDEDLKILEEMCNKTNSENTVDSSWMSMISDDFLNNFLIE